MDRRPYLFQLPILRLLLEGGYMSVCIFFIMSGYVCSIKPLKLATTAGPDETRKSIASSVVRRLLRLAGPASIATVISATLSYLGAFNLARSLPGGWLSGHSSGPVPGFVPHLRLLFLSLVETLLHVLLMISFVLGIMMAPGSPEIHSKQFNGQWHMNFGGQWLSTSHCWQHHHSHPRGVALPLYPLSHILFVSGISSVTFRFVLACSSRIYLSLSLKDRVCNQEQSDRDQDCSAFSRMAGQSFSRLSHLLFAHFPRRAAKTWQHGHNSLTIVRTCYSLLTVPI